MVEFACWPSLRCHWIATCWQGLFFGISKILNTSILCRSSWTPPFQAGNGESIWKYKVLSSIVFAIFLSGIHKVQPIAFSTKKCVTRQKDTSDTLSTASRGVMPKEEAISSSTWELVQMMALLEARCRHEDRWIDVAIVAVINTPSWLAH